jgi:hypothetical protein
MGEPRGWHGVRMPLLAYDNPLVVSVFLRHSARFSSALIQISDGDYSFDAPGQLLIVIRNLAERISGLREFAAVGFGAKFLGAHPPVLRRVHSFDTHCQAFDWTVELPSR